MEKRFWGLFLVLFLLWLLLANNWVAASNTNHGFIPNRGQWPAHTQYRSAGTFGKWMIGETQWRIQHSVPLASKKGRQRRHRHNVEGVKGHVLQFNWIGARAPEVEAREPGHTRYNYFRGKNPEKWAGGLKAYRRLKLKGLYEGVDAQLETRGHQIKYSLTVAPGTAPSKIKMHIAGADSLRLENDGQRLVMYTSLGRYVETMPLVHQPEKPLHDPETPHLGRQVPCRYQLNGDTLHFTFPDGYDPRYPLVIDPKVIFSSASGVVGVDNWGFTGTYGPNGEAYSGGIIFEAIENEGIGGPEAGAFQATFQGGRDDTVSTPWVYGRDVLVYKLSADGTQREYMTYLGGRDNEQPHSMIVNAVGELIIMGFTFSDDFPVTATGLNDQYRGNGDIFVVRLSENGARLESGTFLGGSSLDGVNYGTKNDINIIMRSDTASAELEYNYGDEFRGEVNLDEDGRVLIASVTRSGDWNLPGNRIYGNFSGGGTDGVVVSLSPNLSRLNFMRYLGGNGEDAAYSLSARPDGSLYVAGGTNSRNFPVGSNGHQSNYLGGRADGWLLKLSRNGNNIQHGTYVGNPGGNYDQVFFVKTSKRGIPYVFGQSEGAYPETGNVYDAKGGGHFISVYSPDLRTQRKAMRFGNSDTSNQPSISPTAFLVDRCGRVYISGWGGVSQNSNNPGILKSMAGFTTTGQGAIDNTDGSDFYLAVFGPGLSDLRFGTYYGGISNGRNFYGDHVDGGTSRFDPRGVVFQSVCAACGNTDFRTEPNNVFSSNLNSVACTNGIFKIDLEGPSLLPDFSARPQNCLEEARVDFEYQATGATDFQWIFGDGTTSSERNPTHVYPESGTYSASLVVRNPNSCNVRDTITRDVTVLRKAESRLDAEVNCQRQARFRYRDGRDTPARYFWYAGDGNQRVTQEPVLNYQYQDTGLYQLQLIVDKTQSGGCSDTLLRQIRVEEPQALFSIDTPDCGFAVSLNNQSRKADDGQRWNFGDGQTSNAPNPEHLYPDSGTYQVSLVINPGVEGCEDSLVQPVYLPGFPSNQVRVTTDTCVSGARFEALNEQEDQVRWHFGDDSTATERTVFHNYRDTGRFELLLITRPNASCADSLRRPVDIELLRFADWAVDTLLPCSLSVLTENLSAQIDSARWEINGVTQSREQAPRFDFAQGGTYDIKMVGYLKEQCRDSLTRRVRFDSLPQVGIKQVPQACANAFALQATSQQQAPLQEDWTYRWRVEGQPETVEQSIQGLFTEKGQYEAVLSVRTGDSCPSVDTAMIVVDTIPEADFSAEVLPCEASVAVQSNSIGAFDYRWTTSLFGDGLFGDQREARLEYSGEESALPFFLIINPETLCADTLLKEITLPPDPFSLLEVPNVFTPNGDGLNDTWRITLKASAPANPPSFCEPLRLRIYNRWGQALYEINDLEIPFEWNGDHRRTDQSFNSGTYFYFLEYEGRTRKGSLYLKR